jgi:hypothetical protein
VESRPSRPTGNEQNAVAITPVRFGIPIEPSEGQKTSTTWDRESIEAAVEHFKPVFEETKSLRVYIRIGEDTETEHEDLSLLMDAGERPSLPVQNVLHIVTFLPGPDNDTNDALDKFFDVKAKYYVAEAEWYGKQAREGQYIDVRPYPIPFPVSGEPVDTLDKALKHLHISEAYQQIYPSKQPQS